MGIYNELDFSVQEYIDHIKTDYEKNGRCNKKFYYEIGRKYIHIIMEDNQRSSHSWVMINDDAKFKQGDILKSATWRGPARNFARGNVLSGDYKNIRWVGA